MLDLGFSETSQNFSSFRQLFFIVSKGVPKEKTQKPVLATFQHFSFGPPLETMKKFQLSISLGRKNPHYTSWEQIEQALLSCSDKE